MKKINMADPYFTQEDRRWIHIEVDKILDGALSMGPNVKAFENEFANRIGVRHAIAMNSCTSSLEAALLALGATGREVIVPSQTFIASAMAVHLTGGTPVFAEISASTLCLDLKDVKLKVNNQTAGIILVHMAGMITSDILDFREFCNNKGLFLIEDAAHAPGACFGSFEAGSIGDVGCFSFFPTKVMTSGEGGMLTTNDDDVANFARSFQNRGKDMNSSNESYILPARNVRMTEMTALIGRVQLSHLDEFINRRRQIVKIYIKELSNQEGCSVIYPEELKNSSFWKLPILLENEVDRKLIQESMNNAGIAVDRTYHPALHLQPIFKDLYGLSEGLLPITEDIMNRHLCLPCHPRISDDEVIYISDIIKTVLNRSSHKGASK